MTTAQDAATSDACGLSFADVLDAQLDGTLPYPALKRLVRFLRDAHPRYPRRARRFPARCEGRSRGLQNASPATQQERESHLSPSQIPSPPLCSITPCSLPPRPSSGTRGAQQLTPGMTETVMEEPPSGNEYPLADAMSCARLFSGPGIDENAHMVPRKLHFDADKENQVLERICCNPHRREEHARFTQR
jgi:hypothetical protein